MHFICSCFQWKMCKRVSLSSSFSFGYIAHPHFFFNCAVHFCQPLGGRVLVKIKSAEEKTVGGILLPSTAQSKPQGGELVAVEEGKTLGKNKLEITKEDDIVGILETDEVKDLKPLNDLVLFKVAEVEQKTAGGLFLTEASKDKNSLPDLVKLELSCCNQCFKLSAFGKLQNLECLYVWKLGSVKHIGCEFCGLGSTDGNSTGGEDSVQSVVLFLKLHTLEILHIEECEEWHLPFRRGVEIFPKLRTLTVDNLMKLQMLPPGLGKLKTLEELFLDSIKFRIPELFGIIAKITDNVTLSAEGEGGESATPVAVFSVLKKLTLYNMPEWEEQEDEIRRDEKEFRHSLSSGIGDLLLP
ncbi:hypothetical protein IFM89_028528 [Coptis chinensis]|uniref:Uncharacterized protein n=1 Tax=Coptis chinensis TaxID=261450 RepID=A0A835IGL4_9MAGN|nr:hypothetical protein IFM89_028528 [Coptis chinensis]